MSPLSPFDRGEAFSVKAPPRFAQSSSGFALLITITLLSFLVLLLVALATLTKVETQVATNNQDISQARQNALMALNIAMGQLQKYTGPDQRVTATADLASNASGMRLSAGGASANTHADATTLGIAAPDNSRSFVANGLVGPQKGTRVWTGVWGNYDKQDDSFKQTPAPVLLNWLVSGNEKAPVFNIDASTGKITSNSIITIVQPNMAVQNINATTSTALTDNITINNQPAVLLAGAHTTGNSSRTLADGSNESAEDRFVIAPLVNIQVPANQISGLAGSNPTPVGRYAWWIGDEGVKAKVNTFDPNYDKQNMSTADTNGTLAANRFRVAARIAPEALSDFAKYPRTIDSSNSPNPNYPQVKRMLSPAQLTMIGTAGDITTQTQTQYFHDITTYSEGVLSDSLHGGLKHDLTFEFEAPALSPDLANQPLIPNGVLRMVDASKGTGAIEPANPTLDSGPWPRFYAGGPVGSSWGTTPNTAKDNRLKWDLLSNWYKLADRSPQTTIYPQPATPTQQGIAPTLIGFRLGMAIEATDNGPIYVRAAPMFILANSYTKPMNLRYGMNLSLSTDDGGATWTTSFSTTDAGPAVIKPNPDGSTTVTYPSPNTTQYLPADSAAPPTNYWLVANGIQSGTAKAPLLSSCYFRIPENTVIPAGEAILFRVPNYSGDTPLPVFNTSGSGNYNRPGTKILLEPGALVNPSVNFIRFNTGFIYTPPPAAPAGAPATTWSASTGGGRIAIHMFEPDPANPDATMSQSPDYFPMGSPYTNNVGSGNYKPPARLIQMQGGVNLGAFGATVNGPITTRPTIMAINAVSRSILMTEPRSGVSDLKGNNGAFALAKDYNIRGSTLGRVGVENFVYGLSLQQTPLFVEKGSSMAGGSISTQTSSLNDFASGSAITWGRRYDMLSGPTDVQLYDVPQRRDITVPEDMPVLSIGELQHANLTADDDWVGIGDQPGNAVGNSYFNPMVYRQSTVTRTTSNSNMMFRAFDISYIYNTVLWDRFFFSSISSHYSDSDLHQNRPFSNSRLKLDADIAPIASQDLLAPGSNGQAAARYLMTDGAFNINSTSIAAWQMVLSANRDLSYYTNSGAKETTAGTPFPRSMHQGALSFGTTGTQDASNQKTVSGYRVLSDTQIANLATAIVQQVRLRGPFVSLSHFINRTLAPISGSGAPPAIGVLSTTRSGALQSAIDFAHFGNPDAINNTQQTTEVASYIYNTIWANQFAGRTYPGINQPATETTGTDLGGNRSVGMPGWLTQADILQSLGPVLSARSDTFVIRTYGESLDPINSTSKAKAWCEAVVQRYPDYIDQADPAVVSAKLGGTGPTSNAMPAYGGSSALTPVNTTFGRRYRIVSFRWLTPNDI